MAKKALKFAITNSIKIDGDVDGGILLRKRDTMLAERFATLYKLKSMEKRTSRQQADVDCT